jgi:hypothetical protein
MATEISSTQEFIQAIFHLRPSADFTLYFRGHSDASYKPQPSLFRQPTLLQNEHLLFREILISNPADFSSDLSAVDKLARMQHYSLPTRLLDLTSNPLIGLYFTCKAEAKCDDKGKKPEPDGEVIIFKVKKTSIKFFDSDTVSCIANLAQMSKDEKDNLQADFGLDVAQFNVRPAASKLWHFICQEKPYFTPRINPQHLQSIVVVRTKLNNNRILSQSGAFMLFGHGATLEGGRSDITVDRISVKASVKKEILRELDELNINESTVFPYIENSARYIKSKYSG